MSVKTFLSLISLLAVSAFSSESVGPVNMTVAQECSLDTTGPFRKTHEIHLFKIVLENGPLANDSSNMQEMLVWADGKNYPLYSQESRTMPGEEGKKSGQLYGQELRTIMDAGYVKLRVKYKEQVKEEQSSEGKSPYFTTVRTTVEKEEFLPLQFDKTQIQNEFAVCRQRIEEDERRQSLVEIATAGAGILVLTALGWMLRRSRKKGNETPRRE